LQIIIQKAEMTSRESTREEQRNTMQSLKRKMNKVKDAGKKCKLFFQQHQQNSQNMSKEEL